MISITKPRRALVIFSLLVLSACGGGGGDSAADTPNQRVATNSAPTIDGTLILIVTQDQPYNFAPSASDADGDALTFSILGKPTWADFDVQSGALTGVPGNDDVGTYEGIVITVSDGKTTASLPTFSLSVINVNDAPTIAGSPSSFVESGKYYRFVPTTVDPDGQDVRYTVLNKPAWASFNSLTGELAGTPGASDVGTFQDISIGADDGEFTVYLPAFSLTVTDFAVVDWVAEKPIVPLLGTLNFQDEADGPITAEELDGIAANFAGVHGNANLMPRSEDLDYIRSLNIDFVALPYLNSSQANMSVAESDPLHMINFYREASLSAPITAGSTVIPLTLADEVRGWGLKASTVAGDQSVSATQYVTFVRIGDELMRIEATDADAGTITVSRGFAATAPSAHAAGSDVFAPVYVAFDDILNNGLRLWTIPGNEYDLDLRYSLQVGQPEVANYMAEEVIRHASRGRDGAWLDICSPAFFHPGNAFGAQVTPWNFETGAEFTPQERKEHQERKLDRIQNALGEATGNLPVLTANNIGGGSYFEEGGGAMDYIFTTAIKPRPINGAVVEAAFSQGFKGVFRPLNKWSINLSTLIHGAQNGAPVFPWVKSAISSYRPNTADADRFELFDFASILLGWEPGTGATIPIPLFAQAPEGGRKLNLAPWLFYDIGEPVTRAPFDAIDELQVPGKNTFMRHWTRGVVLVNPSETDDTDIDLAGSYIEPVTRERLTSVAMPANTGLILILD